MALPISADERRWRAQDDARTLAQANVIKQDQDRLAAAKAEAKRMAEEQAKEAAAMRGVAQTGGREPSKKPDEGQRAPRRQAQAKKPGNHSVFARLDKK